MDDACSLHISFLACARPSTRYSLSISSNSFATVALARVAATSDVGVEVVARPGQRRQHTRLIDARKNGAAGGLPGRSLRLRVLVLFTLLLLLDVRAVTAVALRTLVNLTLHCWSKRILRPVLLLTRKDALIKEFCVLASIESVVSHVLTVVGSWRTTLASSLALLATRLVPDAVVLGDWVHGLELLHLVDGVIIQIVVVVAHGVAFVKVGLGDATPVLVVIRTTSIYIV